MLHLSALEVGRSSKESPSEEIELIKVLSPLQLIRTRPALATVDVVATLGKMSEEFGSAYRTSPILPLAGVDEGSIRFALPFARGLRCR